MSTMHEQLRAFAQRVDRVIISGTSGTQREQLRSIARDLHFLADAVDDHARATRDGIADNRP